MLNRASVAALLTSAKAPHVLLSVFLSFLIETTSRLWEQPGMHGVCWAYMG